MKSAALQETICGMDMSIPMGIEPMSRPRMSRPRSRMEAQASAATPVRPANTIVRSRLSNSSGGVNLSFIGSLFSLPGMSSSRPR
jgi:hypothetical protein